MIVRGNAQDLAELRLGLEGALRIINTSIQVIWKKLCALESIYRDDGYRDLQQNVMDVMHAMTQYLDDFSDFIEVLKEYEEVLRPEALSSVNFGSCGNLIIESKIGETRDGIINQILDNLEVDIKSFGNTEEKQNLLLFKSDQWQDSLSTQEFSAIRDYTREFPPYYKNINEKLRGKTLLFDKGNRERAELIHSALLKSEVPCNCTVYRGASFKQLGKYSNFSDEELVGKVILDKGFMSTSTQKGHEFGGEIKLEILVPKGAKGAYLGNGISVAGEGESELLFDKGRRLKIIGVYYDMWKNRIIKARMM